MLGFNAVAKVPLAATASVYRLALEPYTFTLASGATDFLRSVVITASGVTYYYNGRPVDFVNVDNTVRLVTFKFIGSNTVSILEEDRIMRVEPRLRKSS